jgi:hypothetical protein
MIGNYEAVFKPPPGQAGVPRCYTCASDQITRLQFAETFRSVGASIIDEKCAYPELI